MADQGYGKLQPEDVMTYLHSHDWILPADQATWSSSVQLWTTEDGRDEVLVPLRRSYRDYSELVFQALTAIASKERRSPENVLSDVAAVGFDVLRFRAAVGESDDSIALNDGLELISSARAGLVAAACATIRPSRSFGRHFILADEYIKHVRMAQTERGSFVIAVRSPLTEIRRPRDVSEDQGIERPSSLPDELDQSEGGPERKDGSGIDVPDTKTATVTPTRLVSLSARNVVGTFLAAVKGAEEAATEYSASADLSAFDRRVDLGVSANLCSALAAIKRAVATSVELSVAWSPREQLRKGLATLPLVQRLSSDTEYAFEKAAEHLRQVGPEHEVQISGQVIELRRRAANQAGRVKIRTSLDGKTLRNVVVSLGVVDYLKAVRAHREGRRLICKGIIEPAGQRMWKMVAPTGVQIES